MAKIQLGFDPAQVKAELAKEEWVPIENDPGVEGRCVGLGSVFSLTPSGKVYMPWATSNLRPCPCCNGTGHTKSNVKRRVAKKWVRREQRQRQLLLNRYGHYSLWSKALRAALKPLQARVDRCNTVCWRCGGYGSHEAWDDERWEELARNELYKHNISLETSEGDGAYLIACEYRNRNTENNEESE